MSFFCTFRDCERSFTTAGALHAHCRDKADHPYCEGCERLFTHEAGLNQHLDYSGAHRTESDEEEEGDVGYGYGYVESDSSEEDYASSDGEQQSDEEEAHFCVSCSYRYFVNEESLNQHLRDSPVHNWCFICSKDFSSVMALAQHSASPVHRPRVHPCPFCNQVHKVPSATAHHVESGCHGITRHQVTNAVHSMGVIPNISVAHRLLGPPSAVSTEVILGVQADESSFDGRSYVCFLCGSSGDKRSKFATLAGLNQHLNSAAHDATEFKCPKCQREYTLISGLIQHIESGACGVARIQQVEDFADSLANQFARRLRM